MLNWGIIITSAGASGVYPSSETMPAVRAEAQKALELDAANPKVHALLCTVAGVYDYDWKEADRQYRLALASDPVPPSVRGRCALSYLLPLGRFKEAIIEFERDLEQDPLSVAGHAFLARTLLSAGLCDRPWPKRKSASKSARITGCRLA